MYRGPIYCRCHLSQTIFLRKDATSVQIHWLECYCDCPSFPCRDFFLFWACLARLIRLAERRLPSLTQLQPLSESIISAYLRLPPKTIPETSSKRKSREFSWEYGQQAKARLLLWIPGIHNISLPLSMVVDVP